MNEDNSDNQPEEKKTKNEPRTTPDGQNTYVPPLSTIPYIHLAYKKKKEADALWKSNTKLSNNTYLESVFLYIKAFLLDELENYNDTTVGHWKNLDEYLCNLISKFNENDVGFRNIYEFILFNVKFHYLYYEGYFEMRREGSGKNALKGFLELKGIVERSLVERFCVVRLEKLEDFVRNELVMTLED
ncbi:hypothetical protein COBT_001076 [Conglomerata obtusa]